MIIVKVVTDVSSIKYEGNYTNWYILKDDKEYISFKKEKEKEIYEYNKNNNEDRKLHNYYDVYSEETFLSLKINEFKDMELSTLLKFLKQIEK